MRGVVVLGIEFGDANERLEFHFLLKRNKISQWKEGEILLLIIIC